MQPLPRQKRKNTPRDAVGAARGVSEISQLVVQPMIAPKAVPTSAVDDADALSDDFEWDSDFGVANNNPDESRTLLAKFGVATLSSSGTMNCDR